MLNKPALVAFPKKPHFPGQPIQSTGKVIQTQGFELNFRIGAEAWKHGATYCRITGSTGLLDPWMGLQKGPSQQLSPACHGLAAGPPSLNISMTDQGPDATISSPASSALSNPLATFNSCLPCYLSPLPLHPLATLHCSLGGLLPVHGAELRRYTWLAPPSEA